MSEIEPELRVPASIREKEEMGCSTSLYRDPPAKRRRSPDPRKQIPLLESNPQSPRELKDNEVYSQLQGMLRGVGENYT